MKEQRPLALALLVGEVDVVEPPGWIHTSELGVGLLLPVEPPEVDALLFKRMVEEIHVIDRELLVGDVEGHIFLGLGIDAHDFSKRRVSILPWLHARGGMQVERSLEALIMNMIEEELRIWKEHFVPGVSAPAEAVARLIWVVLSLGGQLLLVDVPIHINHKDVERHSVLTEAFDDIVEFLVGVGPVARPPRAEGEAWRQRNPSGDAHIIAQRLLIVVAIAEKVPIL